MRMRSGDLAGLDPALPSGAPSPSRRARWRSRAPSASRGPTRSRPCPPEEPRAADLPCRSNCAPTRRPEPANADSRRDSATRRISGGMAGAAVAGVAPRRRPAAAAQPTPSARMTVFPSDTSGSSGRGSYQGERRQWRLEFGSWPPKRPPIRRRARRRVRRQRELRRGPAVPAPHQTGRGRRGVAGILPGKVGENAAVTRARAGAGGAAGHPSPAIPGDAAGKPCRYVRAADCREHGGVAVPTATSQRQIAIKLADETTPRSRRARRERRSQ